MSVSRETKLSRYIELLQRWGATLNLTSAARSSRPALTELIKDCLCIVPHLPPQLTRLIDLGSGQGFPAIPLAIETGVAIDMIEADRRKAAFLTTAMADLGLQGRVHAARIESTTIAPAACVTARALASVSSLISLAMPFLTSDGCALFLKGPAAKTDIEALGYTSSARIELLMTSRPPSTLVKVSLLA